MFTQREVYTGNENQRGQTFPSGTSQIARFEISLGL